MKTYVVRYRIRRGKEALQLLKVISAKSKLLARARVIEQAAEDGIYAEVLSVMEYNEFVKQQRKVQ